MALTRREVLASIVATTALAGCASDDEPGNGGGVGDGADDTPTASNDRTPTEGTDGTPTDADDGTPTVQVRSHPDHGDVLVGPDGMTLYVFDQDTEGEAASACDGGCAESWPPLTVTDDPVAGPDVTADLETFERDDGDRQVTAGGWPLYYFASDEEPGDASGQGVNDVWWVLAPDGTPVKPGDSDDGREY